MDSKKSYTLSIPINARKERLDKYIALHIPELSRTRIKALIEGGHVCYGNGLALTSGADKIRPGDTLTITVPPMEPTDMRPADIPLDVVYEDDALLVINKPAGLTVHPGAGNHQDTLANALLTHCKGKLSGIGGVERPGIVHRLDKDTTGLLVVAKNDKAHHALSKQLASRTLSRHYKALCWGEIIPHSGRIETQLGRSTKNRKKMAVLREGGKQAITHYHTEAVYGNGAISLVECRLETGRTHQIRVHMTHIGHGLMGDPSYGSGVRKISKHFPPEIDALVTQFGRQALHAAHMSFIHPDTNEVMEFDAPLPEDMATLCKAFETL
ncbi:MAG: rluD [Rickettsiales bacterium]|jgi:23S rRNA pseudouridine1911/1915/1917 synthase|nr:rluD [Rickettsiales bacterium]